VALRRLTKASRFTAPEALAGGLQATGSDASSLGAPPPPPPPAAGLADAEVHILLASRPHALAVRHMAEQMGCARVELLQQGQVAGAMQAAGACAGVGAACSDYSGTVLLLPLWREQQLAALSAKVPAGGLQQQQGQRSGRSSVLPAAAGAAGAVEGCRLGAVVPRSAAAGQCGGDDAGQRGVAVLVGCKQLTAKALRIAMQKVLQECEEPGAAPACPHCRAAGRLAEGPQRSGPAVLLVTDGSGQ
jgi:hypothetical protein